jgi:hypothetical protein
MWLRAIVAIPLLLSPTTAWRRWISRNRAVLTVGIVALDELGEVPLCDVDQDGSDIPFGGFALQEGALEMPRFYFHIKHGQMTVLDHEGVEFPDQQEAAKEAA